MEYVPALDGVTKFGGEIGNVSGSYDAAYNDR